MTFYLISLFINFLTNFLINFLINFPWISQRIY